MAYSSDNVKNDFVQPHRYKDILETLKANIPWIKFIDERNTVEIKKKDMFFEVTHPLEMQELMELMFKINNFICRQYRRRKHILRSTTIV